MGTVIISIMHIPSVLLLVILNTIVCEKRFSYQMFFLATEHYLNNIHNNFILKFSTSVKAREDVRLLFWKKNMNSCSTNI